MNGNFDFLRAEWPQLHAEAKRAEQDALFDPRTTCFYARRTTELAVKWIYRVKSLDTPYSNDLAARLHQATFLAVVDRRVQVKMDLIRKMGNKAVHESRPVPQDDARKVLTELFHVLSWFAREFASQPSSKPSPDQQFDASLLPKPGGGQAVAKSLEQVKKLGSELADKDARLGQAESQIADLLAQLAARDATLTAREAEQSSTDELVARLQKEVAAAQATANAIPDTHDYQEAQTRTDIIDFLLHEAGWPLTDKRDREFPVVGMPDGKSGFVDYVLWGADGLPLAVVEAKRASRDAKVGMHQAKLYADCLDAMTGQRPIIYYTNGLEHYIWDDTRYVPRRIEGFHTRDELDLMIQRRTTRRALADIEIRKSIVDRPYQERAIRRVAERFDNDHAREALLVMATGAGKTRTVIALSDVLMRANWAKRVLFLADRRALVRQAINAFKAELPDSSPVNLLTERNTDGRVYAATYPTMLGLINEVENGRRRFGPGYFDLVVIDEAHRSVYQKYRHIFDYFDSLLLGLTATPKDEVDRNTFQLFHIEDGVPTDNYGLDEAIADKWLVPPRAVKVPLTFPSRGIRYDDLTDDEKQRWDAAEWDEDGEIPDGVDPEAVNKWLFNKDTVDKALATLMDRGHKVAGGDLIGKTIVFAKNQRHADFIAERFNANYPEFKGRLASVITAAVERNEHLIDEFSNPDKAPHIAISVDMLDTGIDVPEVVNLVFFKPIRSKTKFWQMVGRGTRLRPDLYGPGQDKTDFFIFDLCDNFEFFAANPKVSDGSVTPSLTQRLFTTRTELVAELDHKGMDIALRDDTIEILYDYVDGMRWENTFVRSRRREVEKYKVKSAWQPMTREKATEIVETLAPLPSTVGDSDEMAKRFDLVVLRGQLALLNDSESLAGYRSKICEIADGLLEQLTIPKVREKEILLREVASEEWWQDVTLPMLEQVRRELRSIAGLLERRKRAVIYTDFEDTLGEVEEVDMPSIQTGTDVERFTAKIRDYLRRQPDNLALQKVKTGKPLAPGDLESLEALLAESGAGKPEDLQKAVENARGLARFIRSLVGLDRRAANEAFAEFLDGKTASANQIDFVEMIIGHLTRHGEMDPGLLFEPPFTDNSPAGPSGMFGDAEVRRLVEVIDGINRSVDSESA